MVYQLNLPLICDGLVAVHDRCRYACLDPDDAPPRVGTMHYVLRWVALTAACLLGILLGWITRWLSKQSSRRLLRLWSRCVIRAAGVSVRVDGVGEHVGAKLVVSNHVSSFDGMALLARFGHFIVVTDTNSASNPVFGRLCRMSGTIFVERGGSKLLAMVRDVSGALRSGESVFVTPEGQIRCREPGGPFPPAVMQAALDADATVQPVLMRCVLRDGTPTAQAAFFPDAESPVAMLRRVLRLRGLCLRITLLPALDSRIAQNRRELASLVKQPIDELAGPTPNSCVAVSSVSQPRG